MAFISQSPTYIPFPKEKIGTGKVYRNPMPYGKELDRFKNEQKITRIVQLCFDKEFSIYGRKNLPNLYSQQGFEVIKFPIEDFKVPESKAQTREMVDFIIEGLNDGNNTLIHCVGGNGRTGLLLACMARKIFGYDGPQAIKWVRNYIPTAVERKIQEKFVNTYLENDDPVFDDKEEMLRKFSRTQPIMTTAFRESSLTDDASPDNARSLIQSAPAAPTRRPVPSLPIFPFASEFLDAEARSVDNDSTTTLESADSSETSVDEQGSQSENNVDNSDASAVVEKKQKLTPRPPLTKSPRQQQRESQESSSENISSNIRKHKKNRHRVISKHGCCIVQ